MAVILNIEADHLDYFKDIHQIIDSFHPVSYTHLDVYKRQLIDSLIFFNRELDHVILDGASSGGIMTSVLVLAV